LPASTFGEVKHIVDELEEMLAAVRHIREVLALFGIERAGFFVDEELGKADDPVEGRAKFM